MPEYNFETLNDKEFELLTRDLLQLELRTTLETFKTGKDGGIDLRIITKGEDSGVLVIQAKHWHKTGYRKLLKYLKDSELPKIRSIKPTRYILSTSVELSPANKTEIINTLKPFIKVPSDIYGCQDLNNLLEKHPSVEESHYKLWLSSVNILQKIIHNGVKGRSEFVAQNIKKNLALYVPNEKYNNALEILNKERFLVIIGEPGIGKTILARMLVYELLSKNFQLVSIRDSVSDAENLWKSDKRQIFYFDDFLGSNYLEISNPKNSESSLLEFLKRTKDDPTKRIILTSRTVILNQARQHFSKLNDPIIDLAKHEVAIDDYSNWTKARILYNHLFFSDLPIEYQNEITKDKSYWKIIKHKNFSPRLIEFLTDENRLKNIEPNGYLSHILESLDHPSLIWEAPYEKQLNDYAKFLLTSLFSIDTGREVILKQIFESRLDFEISTGGFQRKSNLFNLLLEELLGGFMKSEHNGHERMYSFFNPSIVDFLIKYLNKNELEKWRILESAIYIEQFTARFSIYPFSHLVIIEQHELPRLKKIIEAKKDSLVSYKDGSREIYLIDLFYTYFDADENKEYILELLSQIQFSSVDYRQLDTWIRLLDSLAMFDWWNEAIIKRWKELIDSFFDFILEEEQYNSILELFTTYSQSYDEYFSNPDSQKLIKQSLTGYWNDVSHDALRNEGEVRSMYSKAEIDNYLKSLHNNVTELLNKFSINSLPALDNIFEIDTTDLAEENQLRVDEEEYDIDYHEEEERFNRSEETNIIDDLFSK